MKFPTLYKINSRGKKQYWAITADKNSYTIRFGQEGGKEQETTVEIKSGKNIGKSNATTVAEQTVSEAQSKWNAQLDKGYGESVEKAVDNKESMVRPMLAQSYQDHPKKIIFPCYGQPKLDGVRCLYENEVLNSRKGKPFKSLPHIVEQIKNLEHMLPGLVLDGELYNKTDTFQTLVGLIKRDNDPKSTIDVEFHVYDCFYPHKTEPYDKRLHRLLDVIMGKHLTHIKPVFTKLLYNHNDVIEYHAEAVADGYEGIMLRNAHAPYLMNRRSYDLQKVKVFQTEEFKIVGAEQNRGGQADQCTIICETENGTQFGAKPMGNAATREQYWIDKDKNIGKMLTVKFFEWTTSDNPVPRFPIGISIRDYE